MRIGILGGTFNPIHIAHISLAEAAKEKLGLDKVVFIPTYIPPHKGRSDIVDAGLRYDMVELAVKSRDGFEVSDIEVRKKGTSYSVETLKMLKNKYGPEADLFFIAGSDSISELSTWKDVEEIFSLAHFVIANRPNYPMDNIPREAEVLELPDMDISSSDIRRRLIEGKSIQGMVPEGIVSYIEEKGLYKYPH